jgi:hypothetical protein
MSKRLFVLGVVAIAILTTSAFAASRGVIFTPIGFIEDPGPFPASLPLSMTADGNTMIVTPTPYGAYCVFWNLDTGWGQQIGSSGSSCVISADGSTVMGSGYNSEGQAQASVWLGELDQWDPLPLADGFEPCGSSGMSFYDMGGNADFATGLTWEGCSAANAFRWDAATDVTTNLYGQGDDSRGNAISADGNTIVGWNKALCGGWRGGRWDDGVWSYIDGQGAIEPKICSGSGDFCCGDSDCPEVEVGTCENDVCVGGPLDGNVCNYNSDCPNSNEGYCDQGTLTCVGGTEPGAECTSNWSCDNTAICIDNPDWDADAMAAYKGEAADVSADGKYVFGQNYGNSDWNSPDYDPFLWASAYIQNPNGSFTQVSPPPGASPYDSWTPFNISDDGGTAVGRYGWWIYSYPTVWTAETGTLDLQWFLIGQGLDDLWFWYLRNASTVSADGTIIGGDGYNPDNWIEGYHLDMKRISLCHIPGGDFDKARTLNIALDSVSAHLAHGDVLSTCEFAAGGNNARAALRGDHPSADRPTGLTHNSPDFNVKMGDPNGPKLMDSYVDFRHETTQRPEQRQQAAPRAGKTRQPRDR